MRKEKLVSQISRGVFYLTLISLLMVVGSCTKDEISLTNTRKDMTDKLRGTFWDFSDYWGEGGDSYITFSDDFSVFEILWNAPFVEENDDCMNYVTLLNTVVEKDDNQELIITDYDEDWRFKFRADDENLIVEWWDIAQQETGAYDESLSKRVVSERLQSVKPRCRDIRKWN